MLSRLVAEVYTIEIIEPPAKTSPRQISEAEILSESACRRWIQGPAEHAPFDSVIVTSAPNHIPQALIDQLQDGGRMIIPDRFSGDQQLYLMRKHGAKIYQQAVLRVFLLPGAQQ